MTVLAYDPSMTTRITVSLPDDLVVQAREAVKNGRASSVSAYVADALRRVSSEETLADLVRDMIAEDGAPDEAAYRWAHEVLDIPWQG
jgi:Arc/MetJ-type ribon-helix-helix transcriptional regulator